MKRWLSVALLAGTGLVAPAQATPYADTLWPTGHRDARNTDYVPLWTGTDYRVGRYVLAGAPILWPPSEGQDGRRFVTSGRGKGHANFHALDRDGTVLWEAPQQYHGSDLDAWAVMNAPVVDEEGHVYVGDSNQLWAWYPDGRLKWYVNLHAYGVEYGFMTVVLTRQGYVGGVTTDGQVIFFTRETGKQALPVLSLPGGPGPEAESGPAPGLWEDLMAPELVPVLSDLIQGWTFEVANTPAWEPSLNRLYITAAGDTPDTGVLYGIDVFDDTLAIAFAAPMGAGSGTSPVVNHAGNRVYALDGEGRLVAVDALTGDVLWTTAPGGGSSASPTVGPDGTVYTAQQDRMRAYTPAGSLHWEVSYNDFCADKVPEAGRPWSWFLSEPVAFIDSIFVLGRDVGWHNLVCGYEIPLLMRDERTRVPIPLASYAVAIDPATGGIRGEPVALPETSEGFITPSGDGRLYVTQSGAIGSMYYHTMNRFLPEHLEVPEAPRGGLLLLEASSPCELARDSLKAMLRDWDETLKSPEAVRLGQRALSATAARCLQSDQVRGSLEQAGERLREYRRAAEATGEALLREMEALRDAIEGELGAGHP